MLSIVRGGGGEGRGGQGSKTPVSHAMHSRLQRECDCQILSIALFLPLPAFLELPPPALFSLPLPQHPHTRPYSPVLPPPISSPQMWFGVLASRCNEDHYLISIKQIFVSRIFLCAVINQVNRSFTIDSEAARLKSYLEKKKNYPRYVILLEFFFNIAKQYGVFEFFPFCLLSL